MVIAVPVFTKRDQTKPRQVEPLHSSAVDHPPLRALAMGEMTNGPMSAQRHKDAQTHAPQNKTHPPSKTTRQPQAVIATATGVPSIDRQGHLPRGFRFQNAGDGPAQRYNASAPRIPLKSYAMTGMGRTAVLSLMPIAHVMLADHAHWPCHPDQHPKPD